MSPDWKRETRPRRLCQWLENVGYQSINGVSWKSQSEASE